AKFRPGEAVTAPDSPGAAARFIPVMGVGTALEAPKRLPQEGLDLKDYLEELESRLIRSALNEANGVVSQAAELLKLRRTTLTEKMRKYGLRRESV
ncbi:MAG: helix-turn-helix domain-containing protein, partial [Candidatus Competibacteraceae bacterium]|nr:helix-turn-helix domain-containing protein [Candidatus Competibacteraceae bacterium]